MVAAAVKRSLRAPTALFLGGWILYFIVFWSGAIVENAAAGISAEHNYIWGDWALHFTMGSSMAYRKLFLDSSPLLIGHPFSYPFFVNLISALLIRAGVPFFSAFTWPSCVFSIAS